MAEVNESDVYEALDQGIMELAKKAGSQNVAKHAEGFASAARQLAEARAWFTSPSSGHGANGSAGD